MSEFTPTELKDQLDGLEASIADRPQKSLKDELSALESSIERIPSPPPSPSTTLQLQGRAGSEAAWQSYLRYFLDPSAPHGLDNDALNRILQGINRRAEGDIPEYAPEDVEVIAEEQSESGNQPDIIIQSPDRFFICCELKLYASEGNNQTKRYASDPDIGDRPKDTFPEQGRNYLYIKRPGQPDAQADEFINVTWETIQDWLNPLILNNGGRYPTRTTAQLQDFLDTIDQDMTEDAHLKAEREKMELYFNHEEAIQQARKALETVYEHERDHWRRRFLENHLPDSWTPDWHCNSNRYGQIFHTDWRQDDNLQVVDASIEMHFVHLIRNIESFEDGRLTMQLRWPGESPYRERFKELFVIDRYAEKLDPILQKYDIQKRADYSYNNPRFIEKTYSVVKSGLPESYFETLSQAVDEHIQLAPVINKMLTEAIKDVEE